MRSSRSCSRCVAWLVAALILREAGASHLRAKETLHVVDKVYVTTQLQRRGNTCPVNHSLCPDSAGGGCCPDRYSCAPDSCVATTAGTTSACGKQAYYACGIVDGGGCCPEGYICGPNDCSAPPGVTTQPLCPVNYYLCPASYNYGCCQSGMGCGLRACYATTPLTYVFTQTFTTTTDGNTLTTTATATTVSTPSTPSGIPDESKGAWPKFIPTTQPKASEIPDPNNNPGLTQAQLGGIVGGAIALLVIVLTATFIIVRRLRKTAKAVALSKKGSSSGGHGTRPTNQTVHYRPTPSQVDHLEYDDLLQPPANARQSASTSEFTTPFPSSNSEVRHSSPDANGDYFDIQRVQNIPGRHSMSTDPRTSVDSHNAPLPHRRHTRNMSNASELSDGSNGAGVGSPLLPAELGVDGGVFAELPATPLDPYGRRRSSQGVVSPLSAVTSRPSLSHARRRSDPQTRDRSSSSATPGPPLDVVAESVEQMHGYFGPQNVAAGQTRAGVDLEYDISSPIAPRRGPPQL